MFSIGARVKHPIFGEGIIVGENSSTWEIFFRTEDKEIAKSFEDLQLIERSHVIFEADAPAIDVEEIADLMRKVLDESNAIEYVLELGDRWRGGKFIMQPANTAQQSKEIPIETFFHKIVMMRDRMRVLEQNINSSDKLDDIDKVQLQQYITRCYGSMTTFNILIAEKEDYFKGEAKK